MPTKFHVAVVVYKSSSGSKSYKTLYEESFVLVQAADESTARARIQELARERTATFTNQAGEEITWSLHKIVDVNAMLDDEIGEVTELYSRHFSDIDAYKNFDKLA